MKHMGNLTVTTENLPDFPAVEEIYGHLRIGKGVNLRAPELVSVRGWLTLEQDATFDVPMLGQLTGWVTLGVGSRLLAPNLVAINGDLVIAAGVDTRDFANLTTVYALILQRDASGSLPNLTGIRENLSIAPGATLKAGRLTNVGGSITLKEHAVLEVETLGHIGRFYDADETASIVAPKFLA